ncbi:ankyrin repeat-containing domain protein [Aspergillus aurantiobrunneus]
MSINPTTLADLPAEICLDIGSYLSIADLNSLARTTRLLHAIFSPPLYRLGAAHVGRRTTPLIWAIHNRHLPIVERLLKAGADPSVQVEGRTATTAFHKAVSCYNTKALKVLLQTGDWMFSRNNAGYTPLQLAVLRHRVTMLCMILDDAPGRYPDDEEVWSGALSIAAYNGHVKAARRLLEAAAKTTPRPSQRAWPETIIHATRTGKPAVNGHLKLVELYLLYGSNVNAINHRGATPLYLAVVERHIKVVERLVEAGADVNIATTLGEFALQKSVYKWDIEITRLLLKAGANVNQRDQHGQTAFHSAMNCNDLSLVQLLVDSGADISVADSAGETPLFFAASFGKLHLVNYLLSLGAHNKAEKTGVRIPLYIATRRQHIHLFQPLVDAGFLVNSTDDFTPLMYASNYNDLPAMREFIRLGADVNYVNRHGKSVVDVTLTTPGVDALSILLDAGADISTPKADGTSVLHQYGIREDNIQFLIENGADIHAVGPDNRTPLHVAVESDDQYDEYQRILPLLKAGISTEARDSKGDTALHIAVRANSYVTRLLLQGGADVNARNADGATPLHIAANYQRNDAAEIQNLLIDARADVAAEDNLGCTPLHVAAVENNKALFKRLLDRCIQQGSDCLKPSGRGITVVEQAAGVGSVPMLSMLAARGINVVGNNDQHHGLYRGTPAVHIAATYGHASAVKYLVTHGADPHYIDLYGRTAMDWANLYEPAPTIGFLHRPNFYYTLTVTETRTSILKSSVVGLATYMLTGDTRDCYKLGKALQYLDNTPAAKVAYSFGHATCDACCEAVPPSAMRFICTRCPEIDMCAGCMESYHEDGGIFHTCKEHEFISLIEDEHALPGQEGKEEKALSTAQAEWVENIISVYSDDNGELKIHVPQAFTEERPAVSYRRQTLAVDIEDHPLAKSLPKAMEAASVQPGPLVFRAFAAADDALATLDFFIYGDKPQMSLFITSFNDATLVSLSLPHTLMDVMGQQALLRAWSLVLAGQESEVPPLLNAREDAIGAAADMPVRATAVEYTHTQIWRIRAVLQGALDWLIHDAEYLHSDIEALSSITIFWNGE